MMPNWREAGAPARSDRLAAALALTLVLAGAWPAPSPASAQEQGQVDVVLDGKGWGHGVGMAQDGALAMGAAGSSTEEILAAFYPGTSLGEAGGAIDVSITSQPAVEIGFPAGGQVRDASSGQQSAGFPVTVQPGGSVAVSGDGGLFRVVPLAGAVPEPLPPPPPTTTVPNAPTVPPTVAPPLEPTSSGPLWAVPAGGATAEVGGTGRYRGILRMEGGDGGVQVVNRVDVEDYLRGMGEIRDPGWPAASLQAQAIAARTYAVRAIRSGSTLCPDDRCQVYLGATAEYSAMDSAVAATAGQVLLYNGSLALSVYSARGGGISATPAEGFRKPDGEYHQLVSS
ncbi:MAG: SpoIID/LytB domain-containing protein, partial [Acidimicrobiales bacterium]